MNLRFVKVVAGQTFLCLYAIPKAEYMVKHPEKYSYEQRFKLAHTIIDSMRRSSRTKTVSYGLENIPQDSNFVLYSNHQGKYDAIGILLGLNRPCGVLWAKDTANKPLSGQVCKLLGCVVIDLHDMKDKVRSIKAMTEEIKKGRSYLIFPEGGYDIKNRNEMQEFQSGCFSVSLHTNTPIVPVAIYDSYKAMNSNSFKKVVSQVHYLKPILPEEYAGMKKNELSDLVRGRIAEKLAEIEALKKEEEASKKK